MNALQEQYEFIHCGLSELVVCGETEVAVANLRISVKNLKKKGDDGMTGFQRQMKVYLKHNYLWYCSNFDITDADNQGDELSPSSHLH